MVSLVPHLHILADDCAQSYRRSAVIEYPESPLFSTRPIYLPAIHQFHVSATMAFIPNRAYSSLFCQIPLGKKLPYEPCREGAEGETMVGLGPWVWRVD